MKVIQKIIVLFITISFLGCNPNTSTKNSVEMSKAELLNYENTFKELKDYLAKENGNLWNHQLYGPILLINTESRVIVANEADNKGLLAKNGDLFTGILPDEINIANTAINWNGKRWTMVMLPLPQVINERLSLLTHELFHRIQPEIGFSNLKMTQSNHLDDLNGRIYLKLELEALKKALRANDDSVALKQIQNALLFRNFRYKLFPGAKEIENNLELTEGLAEYTGSILSGRTDEKLRKHYVEAIDNFYNNQTFVRSFAYVTLPVYGYFMYSKDSNWNKNVSENTNLTDYVSDFFKVTTPVDLQEAVTKSKADYDFNEIAGFETNRANEQKKLITEYLIKFQENPTLTIQFENMNIGFNPGNIMPLKDLGTVYPNLRITDSWGILTVDNGALLSNHWDKVTITEPIEILDKLIKGDGWKLELNNSWELKKIGSNYTLQKK